MKIHSQLNMYILHPVKKESEHNFSTENHPQNLFYCSLNQSLPNISLKIHAQMSRVIPDEKPHQQTECTETNNKLLITESESSWELPVGRTATEWRLWTELSEARCAGISAISLRFPSQPNLQHTSGKRYGVVYKFSLTNFQQIFRRNFGQILEDVFMDVYSTQNTHSTHRWIFLAWIVNLGRHLLAIILKSC